MIAKGTVLFALAVTLLILSYTSASPANDPPNEAGSAAKHDAATALKAEENRDHLRLETAGALALLVESQDDAEPENPGIVFEQRVASIEQRVHGDSSIKGDGGWVGHITQRVPDWFGQGMRVELGRKLVALQRSSDLNEQSFFGWITLGGYLVLTADDKGRYLPETARRIAAQEKTANYNPEPLLQSLVTSVGMLEPKAAGTLETTKRYMSFFYCLQNCLARSGSGNHPELVASLGSIVHRYLCQIQGEDPDCPQDLETMAKKAHFASCPAEREDHR